MKKTLFIDVGPLLEQKMSGIGHTTKHIVEHLSKSDSFVQQYDIKLIYPKNKKALIERFQFNRHVDAIYTPVRARILNGLARYNLLPPMDILFGRGVYLFPNFKNWPLVHSKSLTYIHDIAFKIYPEYIEPSNLKMLDRSVNRYMNRTDVVITVSDSSRAEILKFYPKLSPEKVKVVKNGVDLDFFNRRNRNEIRTVAKKYGLPSRYFIYISSIEPRKNLTTLLDAFELIAQEEGDLALLLVGGMGWLNEDVMCKIQDLQNRGYRIIRPKQYVPDEDLPALLSGARALVHVPVHEGFGLSPLQAIACGTPVIVSDIPAIREVVGDAGVYVEDLYDSAELAKRMRQINRSSPTEERRGLYVERASLYSWNAKLSDLEELIKNVEL